MTRIFTEEGLKKLHTELDDRKIKMRQSIADAIKEAKDQGDLSENAEYSEAKRQQNENESRIAELEAMLKRGGPVPQTPFNGLEVLLPARDYANRHASILLALDATLDAMDQAAKARAAG